jgi:DNA-directed RNA polymerase specialized sigma24 family protein
MSSHWIDQWPEWPLSRPPTDAEKAEMRHARRLGKVRGWFADFPEWPLPRYPNEAARQAMKEIRQRQPPLQATVNARELAGRRRVSGERLARLCAFLATRRDRSEEIEDQGITGYRISDYEQSEHADLHEKDQVDLLGTPELRSQFLSYLERQLGPAGYSSTVLEQATLRLRDEQPRAYEVLALRFLEGHWTHRDIAAYLHVHHSTVQSDEKWALAKLRDYCKEYSMIAQNCESA